MGNKNSVRLLGAVSKWLVFAVLLTFVCVGFYFDRLVAPAQEGEAIDKIFTLLDKPTDDGKGLPKDTVQDEIGFPPESTREVTGTFSDLGTEKGLNVYSSRKINFEVETYRFKRSVPFSLGQFVEVAYLNGAMFSVVVNDQFDPSDKRFKSLVISHDDGGHRH